MKDIESNKKIYEVRQKPEKHTKYKMTAPDICNRLSKVKKEKDYDYYLCDYCNEEIKILKNTESKGKIQTGGIVTLPQTLTDTTSPITLALCNKCFKKALKEFEED